MTLKDFPNKQIKQLIVDNCSMTDETFANLLDSVIAQKFDAYDEMRD